MEEVRLTVDPCLDVSQQTRLDSVFRRANLGFNHRWQWGGYC